MAFFVPPVNVAIAAQQPFAFVPANPDDEPHEGIPPLPFGLERYRVFRPPPIFLPPPAKGDNFASFNNTGWLSKTAHVSQVGRNLCPPNWAKFPLRTCKKDLYPEHFRTAQCSEEEAVAYRKARMITVEGRSAPLPMRHLEKSGFPEFITKVIEARNCGSSPTALQAQCWPVALSGRDLVAHDYTASKGQSLAYLVPAIIHVQHQKAVPPGAGPVVLVLTATTEEAEQVYVAAREFCGTSRIRTICLVSGDPKERQLEILKEGAALCIATPGRLVALMEECKINFLQCTYFVIDKADRMLTMGLGKQLRIVEGNVRPDRQTIVVLESRTRAAQQLVEEVTIEPVTVTVGAATREDPTERVEHIVFVCKAAEKEDKLVALLDDVMKDENDRAIVYVERKQTVEELASNMRWHGWPTVGVHGNKTEHQRKCALDALRFGKAAILVTTDVAAKNMALDKVRIVVSYDYPSNPGEYARRLKHAAPPGTTGTMCTFFGPNDEVYAKEMVRFLRQSRQTIPPDLRVLANKTLRT